MTETIIPKCSIDEHIPEDRNYSKYNVLSKLLFLFKSNNSEKLKKWKNKINHFVDAQERFKLKTQNRLYAQKIKLYVMNRLKDTFWSKIESN